MPKRLTEIVHSPHPCFSRRTFLASAAGLVLTASQLAPFRVANRVLAASGATLNIVAHEDDDLLFLSPDLLHAIQAGKTVRTIYITAGDAGSNSSYWLSRQSGEAAAYAQMSGVANSWIQTDAGIESHPIPLFTLADSPDVSLAFLHLPDGGHNGQGYASTNYESLQKLWTGAISIIHAVDGSSSYSKTTLISTLTRLMISFQPDHICTQDYVGCYGDGDHWDHHSVAYFVQAAVQHYTTPTCLTGYKDYSIARLPVNVTGADLLAKQQAFYTYAPYDSHICHSPSSCIGSNYEQWLPRQYTMNS
jgi:LmbE family N-acetylglucosaminyl deacetylase